MLPFLPPIDPASRLGAIAPDITPGIPGGFGGAEAAAPFIVPDPFCPIEP